jgi:ribonuclease P protein component, eubacterial
MTKLESLKKNSHFQRVLRNRVVNNECFTIYRSKNFLNKNKNSKKLYISFVMRKKIGNAVKRNRIKRKLRSIVQKLLKINSGINLDYIYVIFGRDKAYNEYSNSLYEKMKKSLKGCKV